MKVYVVAQWVAQWGGQSTDEEGVAAIYDNREAATAHMRDIVEGGNGWYATVAVVDVERGYKENDKVVIDYGCNDCGSYGCCCGEAGCC